MKKSARGAGLPDPKAKGKPGKTRGTPEHKPTKKSRARVRLLAGLGFTQEEIGLLQDLGISALVHHYPHELRVGALEADADVLENLSRAAKMNPEEHPTAVTAGIFWAKVRRRWHEVQRVIHGFDPEMIQTFVKQVVQLLRRELPDACPHCKTKLDLGPRIAQELIAISQKLTEQLPQSQIAPVPVPQLAHDGLEPGKNG